MSINTVKNFIDPIHYGKAFLHNPIFSVNRHQLTFRTCHIVNRQPEAYYIRDISEIKLSNNLHFG